MKQVSREKVGIVVLHPNHCFLGFLVMIDVPASKGHVSWMCGKADW
jgi:hypothetical protein